MLLEEADVFSWLDQSEIEDKFFWKVIFALAIQKKLLVTYRSEIPADPIRHGDDPLRGDV